MPNYRLLTPAGSVPLAGKQLVIGSSPDCQIRAEGADVASHHARVIVREDGPPLVEPLSPACKVLVGGKPVAERCELPPGTVLRVGTTDFYLELGGAAGSGAPARRRPLWRRMLRWALWASGAAVLLLVLLVVLVPVVLSEARVKQTIKDAMEDALRRDVSIGGVKLELLHGLKITNVEVDNKVGFDPGRKLLTVSEADVRVDVWKLLRSGLSDLDCRVSLKEPAIFLEREPTRGVTNVDDILGIGGKQSKPTGEDAGTGKKRGGSSEAAEGGPLGPIARMNVKLSISGGTIEFDDRQKGAASTIAGLTVDASVDDFDVAAMKGRVSYEVSMTAGATAGEKPGIISLGGAGDFDMGQARRSALGMDLPQLSGDLCKLSLKNVDASALGRHFGLPGAARDVSVDVRLSTSALDRLAVSAVLDAPEIDAVALGLNDRPVPGLGARVTLDGTVDTAAGDAELTLKGDSRLWEELSGKLSMTGIRPEAPTAGRMSSSFRLRADVAKLTGGEVGRMFSAQEAIKGAFALTVAADGTVEELPYKVTVALDKLLVPASYTGGVQLPEDSASIEVSGQVKLDPASLELRKLTAAGTIAATGVKGALTGVEYTPGTPRRLAEAAGALKLDADFGKLAERYSQVLQGLNLPRENVALTASASGRGGEPIRVNVSVESRRSTGTPDPVLLAFSAEFHESPAGPAAAAAGADKQWDLKNVRLEAKTPDSPSLDMAVTGNVMAASTKSPEFELHIDQTADLASLWDRVAGVLRLQPGMKDIAALEIAGKVRVADGTVRGSPSKITTGLMVDIADLLVKGPGLPPEGIADSKVQLVANLDASPSESKLDARALKVTSTFCTLDLSGKVVDWNRMLGTYRLELNVPDVSKTSGLLAAFGFLPGDLKPTGTVVVTVRSDTGAGTVDIERFQLDTDLVKARISGGLSGMKLVPVKLPDGSTSLALEQEKPSGSLTIEDCVADVRVVQKLRKVFGGIPEDLRGSGPVRLNCRLSGAPDEEFAVQLGLDAGEAALAFGDLFDKPARVAAQVELSGSWNPKVSLSALRMSSLEARLGDMRVHGSGEADFALMSADAEAGAAAAPVDIGGVTVRVSIPEFEPEAVRKLVPALKGLRLGGRLSLTDLTAAVNLKELLASEKPLLAGRLAGLTCRGKLEMRDLELETDQLPNLALRTSGLVSIATESVGIENLAVGLLHKRSGYENRLVMTKGTLASAIAKQPVLADTSRLSVDAQMSSPEIKIDEILAAMEVPAAPPAKGKGTPPPAKETPPPAKGIPAENPYAFLAGYRLKGTLQANRVVYTTYALTDLAADVAMEKNVFNVSSFSAKAYGGTATGRAKADLNHPDIAHEGSMTVRDCDVNQLASEAQGYKDVFAGKVGGELAWKGSGLEPARVLTWNGDCGFSAKGLAARNLDRLAPFEGRTADLAQFLAPELVDRIAAAEFKFKPAGMRLGLKNGTLELADSDGKSREPTLSTVGEDPLTLGFKAKLNAAAADPEFSGGSGIYLKRMPDSWLAKIDYDRLLENPLFKAIPKDKLRRYLPEEMLRESLSKCAADGALYYPLQMDSKAGGVTFGRLKGFDDLFKDLGKKVLTRYAEDELKGKLDLGGILNPGEPEPEPEPKPAAGRITKFKPAVEGNLATVSARITGEKAATVELHAVRANGKSELLKGETCRDGETVSLQGEYNPKNTKTLELRLLDANGQVLDTKTHAVEPAITPEPVPQPEPEPKPEPKKTGSMKIEKWDIGGNLLKPEITVKVKVTGAGASKVELRAVSGNSSKVVKSKDCKDGETVKLQEEFVRGTVNSFEVRLLDADGKVLDKETRGVGMGL